jgi:hypothetical protein
VEGLGAPYDGVHVQSSFELTPRVYLLWLAVSRNPEPVQVYLQNRWQSFDPQVPLRILLPMLICVILVFSCQRLRLQQIFNSPLDSV